MYWIGVKFTDCDTQIDVILWRRDLNWNCFTSTQTQIFTLFRPMCHLNTFTQTEAITFPSYYGNFAVKFSSFWRRYWMNNRDWDRERESFVIKISFLRFTVLSSFISLFRVISCRMHPWILNNLKHLALNHDEMKCIYWSRRHLSRSFGSFCSLSLSVTVFLFF